jgi:hypothetical protein
MCVYVGKAIVLPGPNPTKHDFPNFTHVCEIFLPILYEISYKFANNEFYQIFTSICKS